MARSSSARALTEAHRTAQVRLGGLAAAKVADVWKVIDAAALDKSLPTYLRAAVPIVQQSYAESATMAAGYYAGFRATEIGPKADFTPTAADDLDVQRLATSLVATGVVRVKSAMARGSRLEDAMRAGQYGAAGAAMRFALYGGRDTLLRNVAADRRARGWTRVTSGNACDYCEGLAGATFKEGDVFTAHDHCSCSAEPAFS